jgi:flagellin
MLNFSVNTNVGAMIALQNLNVANREMGEVQNRINTGFKVSSAKDDAALFNIAQRMRGDLGSLAAVKGSLDRGKSVVDVGLNAAESISDILNRMGELAVASEDASLDADSLASLAADFANLIEQIDTVVEQANFNGTNLVSATGTDVTALAGIAPDGGPLPQILVSAQDLSTTGLAVGAVVLDGSDAARVAVDAAKDLVRTALSEIGSGAKQIEMQQTFVGKLSDSIEAGIGNLVDADLAKESARLQALQVKIQLGVQALSIANQSPTILTSLFGR